MTISQQIVQSLRTQSQVSGSRDEENDDIFDIDEHLKSSSKKVLLQRIDFVEAKLPYNFNLKKLKSKYVILNPGQGENPPKSNATMSPALKMNPPSVGETSPNDGIPTPKAVLFSAEKVELSWKKAMRAGAGLSNLGNTCFLNSSLQCLAYTPPLVNYLIHLDHRKHCRVNGQFCMLCAMQQHLYNIHSNSGQAIKPMNILKNLRMIAKHLQFGRQEDAHEFIRYSVDAMQKSCLFGYPNKMDVHMKATTAVHQIFGGYLRSRVRCSLCKAVSDTYDPFLDISLDINKQGCVDLQRCFELFVRAETLQGDNAYKCIQCKNTVQAYKKFSIHRAPNVLMLQLKRFSSFMGNKINKDLTYPSKFNIAPYMSNKPDGGIWYELYAVLVHSGFSCQSGHYYAYAKAPNGQWYCFNDSSVHQVSVNQALNQQAYLLFYVRNPKLGAQLGALKQSLVRGAQSYSSTTKIHPHSSGLSNGVKTNGVTTQKMQQRPIIGPQLPSNMKQEKKFTFQATSSSKDSGAPVAKQQGNVKVNGSIPASNGLNGERKPLQFSINRKIKPVVIKSPTKVVNGNGASSSKMTKSHSFSAQNGVKSTPCNVKNKSSTLPSTSGALRSPVLKQFMNDTSSSIPGTSSFSATTSHASLQSSSSGSSALKAIVSYSSGESDDEETSTGADYSSLTSTLKGLRNDSKCDSQGKKVAVRETATLPVEKVNSVNGQKINEKAKNVKMKQEGSHCDIHKNIDSDKTKKTPAEKPMEVKRENVKSIENSAMPSSKPVNHDTACQREPILHLLNDEINSASELDETKQKPMQNGFTQSKQNGETTSDCGKDSTSQRTPQHAIHMNGDKKENSKPVDGGKKIQHRTQETGCNKTASDEAKKVENKKERKRHHSTDSSASGSTRKRNGSDHHHHKGKRSPSPDRHRDKKVETPTKKRKQDQTDKKHLSDEYDSCDSRKRHEKHHKHCRNHEDNWKKKKHEKKRFYHGLKRSHSKANGKYSDESDRDSSIERLYCDKDEYEQSMRRKAKKEKKRRMKERQFLQTSINEKSPLSDKGKSPRKESSNESNGKSKSSHDKSCETSKTYNHHNDERECSHETKKERLQENGKSHKKDDKHDRIKSPLKDRPNILDQLLRQSSGKAYGAKVGTWNGEESIVEKDAQQTWTESKTSLTDDWDREYDKGKVKKHKKKDHHHHKTGYNLFQKFQNLKNSKSSA